MPPKSKSPAKPAAAKKKSPVPTAKKKVNPIPPGMRTVTPHLVCAGASEAVVFYKKAFGAKEISQAKSELGKVLNAQLMIGDSMVMLVDEFPAWGSFGPKALKGSSVTIHLAVPNVDAVIARALAAGATLAMPVADMFWGDRYGIVEDPFGHKWSVGTHIRDVSPKEMKAAIAAMG